jgi:hypothetical protein
MKEINTDKVIDAIKLLTGLTPVEEITPARYAFKLGSVTPIELVYDKNKRVLSEDKMKYSASIKMIEVIGQMMQNGDYFLKWINTNER